MSHLSPLPPSPERPKSLKDYFPKDKWVRIGLVGGAAAVLLLGIAIGSGGKGKDAEPQAVPTVTATATVTATPAPAPTITKTVEVTPAACTKYVDLSEKGFSYAAEAMGYMSDGMKAAANFDVAGITAANTSLKTVTPKMNALAPDMNAAKAECRAGAK